MKHLSTYIVEYLKTKDIHVDAKAEDKYRQDPENPNIWQVGDILCGIYGWSMSLPHWFKIIKRSNKQFTCIRLKGKIVSGHKNGQWQEIATDEPYDNKEYKARINKWGYVKIDDVMVHLWDGKTPLHGDDMD